MFLRMLINRVLILVLAFATSVITAYSADRDSLHVVRNNSQVSFPSTVMAGNYSGIAYLRGNQYLVVDDKSETDGFHLFTIDIDSLNGNILQVSNLGFKSSGLPNRDGEGIVYIPNLNTVFVSGEGDGKVLEYTLDAVPTGREVELPAIYKKSAANLGLESLGYSVYNHRLWTCNESTLNGDGERATSGNSVENRLRIQAFDDSLKPVEQYVYKMDSAVATGTAKYYAMGVSEITPLDDGSLLVLEREFYVPPMILGGFVNCKLFQAWPTNPIATDADITADTVPIMDKKLLIEWKTSIGLFRRNIANYEGMCLGPKLSDGSQVVILVSDSQGQYAGMLKDWFKTIVVK